MARPPDCCFAAPPRRRGLAESRVPLTHRLTVTRTALPAQLVALPDQLMALPAQLAVLPDQLMALPAQLVALPGQLMALPAQLMALSVKVPKGLQAPAWRRSQATTMIPSCCLVRFSLPELSAALVPAVHSVPMPPVATPLRRAFAC